MPTDSWEKWHKIIFQAKIQNEIIIFWGALLIDFPFRVHSYFVPPISLISCVFFWSTWHDSPILRHLFEPKIFFCYHASTNNFLWAFALIDSNNLLSINITDCFISSSLEQHHASAVSRCLLHKFHQQWS
jgi:hypothetical protein